MQRVDGPAGASQYQALYCCRVTLADEFIALDVTERRVVAPEDFLDTLFWGHTDPTAALLLERALRWQRHHPLPGNG